MSALGWIDFSSDERAKVKQVLAALSEKGVLDELGIGQIRDAFANRLFPGVSTIQTRAKYFITNARLLRDIQNGHAKKSKTPQLWLKQQEHLLAETLIKVHGKSEDGIIGAESIKKGGVSRRPSSIYWNGLKTFGIIHSPLSLRECCSYLNENSHIAHKANPDHQDGVDDDDVDLIRRLVDLPDSIKNWQDEKQLTIELSVSEAEFLRDKLSTTPVVEHSVLAQLMRNGGMAKFLPDSNLENEEPLKLSFGAMKDLLLSHVSVSEICKNQIKQAHSFSLAMEGAHIRFNILLAKNNHFENRLEELENEFNIWKDAVQKQGIFHSKCFDDWFDAIQGNKVKVKSRLFVERWCQLIHEGASISQLDTLISDRAKDNKKSRSLLNKKLDKSEWVGMRRLDFRWSVARRLLADIEGGLNASR